MRRTNPLKLLFASCLTLSVWGVGCLGKPASLPAPKLTFLDNGEVRVGMGLALGGAVTFISSRDYPGNIINSAQPYPGATLAIESIEFLKRK